MEALGLDIKLLVAQIVNFAILFFVLKKVLYKPLIKAIDDRNKKIADSLINSQKIEEKLVKITQKEEELLAKARDKAKAERAELLSIAEAEKSEIINEAKLAAKREIEKGLESIKSAENDAIAAISDKYLHELADKLQKKMSSDKISKSSLLSKILK